MKKSVFALVVAFATFGVVRADDPVPVEGKVWKYEVHPDWDAVLTGSSFTIPADTGWIVDGETDMAKINAWLNAVSSVRRFYCNGNAALILDNTTTWFAKETGPYFGHAIIVKRGTSRLSNQVGGTFGQAYIDWYIEEGVFAEDNNYFNRPGAGNKVVVSAGATFEKNLSQPNSATDIILEGTGYQGQGALVVSKCNGNGMLSRVTLTNDATIALNVNGTFFDRYIQGQYPGYYNTDMNPAELKLNGHKLTLAGTATTIGFRKVNVTSDGGSGAIELTPLAGGGARTLTFADQASLPANVTITTTCDAVVQYNASTLLGEAQAATIVAEGNLTFKANADMLPEYAVWGGPVQIAAGKNVIFAPGGANRSVTVSGVISGAGGVSVGTSGTAASGTVRILANNTYAGNTYVNTSGKVFVGSDASIPDAATKLTVAAGSVLAAPYYDADGKTTFTGDGIVALAKGQSLSEITLDTSALTNAADVTISSADVAKYYGDALVTWNGYGTGVGYTLTGPYADAAKPLALNVYEGTVRVTGEGTINLGTADANVAGVVSGTAVASSGTVVFDGAKDVVQGDGKFVVGHPTSGSPSCVPRVVVTNSTLRSTLTNSGNDIFKGAFFVGHRSRGVLEVLDGAVVSNKLVVGGGESASTGYGKGAVYQRGGLVVPTTHIPCGNQVYNANVGGAGCGYYALEGGVLRPTSSLQIGIYKKGVLLQTGGEAYFTGLQLSAWLGDGVYTVLNGLTKFLGNGQVGQLKCVGAGTGTATITVQGANAVFDSVDALYRRTYCFTTSPDAGQTKSPLFRLNLNDGGLYKMGGFFAQVDMKAKFAEAYPYLVNFDGGILYLSGATQTPFMWASDDAKAKMAPNVVVYGKGARFQVAAGATVSTAPCPIEAHKAGGLASIALPVAGLSSPVSPIVEITSATGRGATAVALVDAQTMTITNILVTSRGWGYAADTTTVKLLTDPDAGIFYTFPSEAIAVADNEIGGLTMEGPGTLTIGAGTNRWEKWTKVLGGTLTVKDGFAEAVPTNTVLTLSNGATLDLDNRTDVVFAGLDGTGGTVANGAVRLIGDATISARKFISRESTVLAGTLDLSGVTSLTLTDTEVLDESAKSLSRLTLISATEIVWPAGGLTVQGVPAGWRASCLGDKITLGFAKGSVLIIK